MEYNLKLRIALIESGPDKHPRRLKIEYSKVYLIQICLPVPLVIESRYFYQCKYFNLPKEPTSSIGWVFFPTSSNFYLLSSDNVFHPKYLGVQSILTPYLCQHF